MPEPLNEESLTRLRKQANQLMRVHNVSAVLVSSRYIDSITEEQGLALLAEEYGPDVKDGDGEAGDWSENGSGAPWVRVLYPLIEEETDD
jgi:hypothetical protein